ncbi:hypothetical protein GCK32_017911 [Trichostrongylus colubriformis]|uniref:Sugar transporter SWEET1 n=1 Tax=Trichostrongylus colubriformis TaxID=6319 RepID=A0AAN8F390_TRICO
MLQIFIFMTTVQGVVLRKRCCDSLPLPMCIANMLVSTQWCLYGNIVRDKYIMVPNGIGMALAIFQLSLFLIFPRNENGKSMVSHVAGFFTAREEEPVDLEKGDQISTQTSSTGISVASGRNLMRKLSEAIEKTAMRSGSFGAASVDDIGYSRTRTTSVPEISKFKRV